MMACVGRWRIFSSTEFSSHEVFPTIFGGRNRTKVSRCPRAHDQSNQFFVKLGKILHLTPSRYYSTFIFLFFSNPIVLVIFRWYNQIKQNIIVNQCPSSSTAERPCRQAGVLLYLQLSSLTRLLQISPPKSRVCQGTKEDKLEIKPP